MERPPAAVAEDETGIIAMRPNNVMIEPTEPEDGTLQGLGHSISHLLGIEGETQVASGPDRALLYLTDLEATWSAEVPWTFIWIRSGDIALVLEDGSEADRVPLGENYGYTTFDDPAGSTALQARGFRQVPVWDVPADIEGATLRITPQDTDQADTATFDYQGGTIEFTLEFGG